MAHIVFGWELGGGYGHLGPFRPVAERLMASGHRITLIVKDLARAGAAFGDLDVQLYQAPVKIGKAIPHTPSPATFGHLLQNVGFGDPEELRAMVQAWRNLYHLIRPDCLVLDHAPTGILASRGLSIPSFTIGTGFFCPVDEFPLREMAPWRPLPKEDRASNELKFVNRINGILQSNQQPKIDRIGQIYSDVTANLLTTFQELDHYPHRQGGEYLGAWSAKKQIRGGDSAETLWPDGEGLKVYAYLKPFRAIKDLLRWLGGQGCSTLVVGDGLNTAELGQSLPPNVRLADRHFDLATVVKSCDLAIMNGNHGTCCEFLLAGRPVFHIPLTFEQAVFSRRTHELGVSLDAVPNQTQQVIQQLSAMMKSCSFRDQAETFAAQYAEFEPEQAMERCTGIIKQFL
ncbi:glycosyltransferase [Bremerella alba]|uniref:Glycosyl transferase family 28 C-terminal domain-containing protein n=1 Tax=Bremerella alba TaxID=980252 RepID=A0A7V9A8P0_9BACT|nr:hypothetical protein [Bremerella alba]MBA2116690.1 hypothetical protein [Bremerella alba]